MEIDPRLRAGSEESSPGGEEPRQSSYIPASTARRDETSASSGQAASDYPDPPSQFASRQHSTSSTTTGPGFYGTQQSQPQSASHPLYHQHLHQRDSPSSALRASPHLDSADPNDPYSDLKRPRACEACRQLKVRCEPDLVNPNGSCKRCAKAGRSCVVTVPTRKRQKKTDSRVAELERKIDALTASLQASQGHDSLLPSTSGGASASTSASALPPREEPVGRRWLGPSQSISSRAAPPSTSPSSQVGNKRHHSGELKEPRAPGILSEIYTRPTSPATEQQPHDTQGKPWRTSFLSPSSGLKEPVVDIIDRGLVSSAVALEAFTRYVDLMASHIPLVVFPPETQMSDVRKNRPILFHAIIAVAVGPFQPSVQLPLLHEFYKTVGERVIVKGEKSLDLVQGLVVSCTFYIPPDNFEEIKFYQLAQLAVTVGMDIGMYRKSSAKIKPFNLIREVMKHSPASDPDSPEVRRTWLACYFLSVQVSTALRRPILVRWNPYMDECVQILEKSPDALPSDKTMIQWAKLVRIIEEICSQFFSEDSNPSFSDPKYQFTLKAFEKQIEQWRKETFPDHYSPVMAQAEAIVGIYLHEHAMNMESHSDDAKVSDEDISNPTTAARISALSTALSCIHQALDAICAIEVNDLVTIPTISLARTSFAVVALIKLYSIVTAPDSYLGQVIDPSNLRIDYYLDKVIELYAAAGELPGSLTPAKFSTVLSMLREWFRTRKDQNVALREAFNGPRKPNSDESSSNQGNKSQNQTPTGHTPLHLLSEVAMGEPKNQSSPNQRPLPHHHHPNHQPQQQSYPSASRIGFPDPIPQSSPDLLSQSLGPSPGPGTADSTAEPWVQYASQRSFFPPPGPSPFSSTQAAATAAGTGATTTSGLSGFADPTGGMMMSSASTAGQGIFVPELGIQVGSDPENLFALGGVLGDGLFNLPWSTDGSFGSYGFL
ncbi:hypothetical protein P175DRAFT_0434471 [Aspergillus ochraceoroseus IBT 24754]|uniref:Zn(2)-C6 fungal-type domain-containing protein n=1 Tax=Aspergillus ochraceoroseus IBT 24754 TaxID=1392256 RepID=A0A2T5M0S0_9EURO|nr:uncharacterized protein P175DRAFT_0434471 [Aspergillus ochraceoroseus IBT 24754]PTU22133.1 hypothetical protein P175DRAFT_0434471 [Aspergillus ochraceoroseus IBT 24754]